MWIVVCYRMGNYFFGFVIVKVCKFYVVVIIWEEGEYGWDIEFGIIRM